MKKLFLLCTAALAITATAQNSVALANAHWGFEADEARRPNYTTNTAFAIPASWVAGTATITSYRPYIYPNGNQSDKADQGHTGRYCLYMNQPNSASRLPVFAMLPTISDKQMNTLSLEFWARTFNSTLDVNTSNTVYGDWKFGYISSLADTVKANFTQNVHYLQTVELTANWTKYTLDLKDFPAGAYPVIYIDVMGEHNVRYAYIDDVQFIETPTSGPAPLIGKTITYNLTGCTAGQDEEGNENATEIGDEDTEFDFYFNLTEGHSWDGAQISVMMGETALEDAMQTLNFDEGYIWQAEGNEGVLNVWVEDAFTADLTISITCPEALNFPTEFTPATFEDVTVGSNGVYYNPAIQPGANAWLNGSFKFYTYYAEPYMPGAAPYYSDIVVSSNVNPAMAADYNNPVSYLYAPVASPNGNNFAVWNESYYGPKTVILDQARTLTGMYVNNTSAVLNYLTGVGSTFPADGFFMLKIIGLKEGVQQNYVDFYLVDWRNAADKKTISTWQWLDFTTLGLIDEIKFEMYSDDVNEWGKLIPAYFCFDNLGGTAPSPGTAIEQSSITNHVSKIIRSGQVFIRRGEHLYNAAGQVVR